MIAVLLAIALVNSSSIFKQIWRPLDEFIVSKLVTVTEFPDRLAQITNDDTHIDNSQVYEESTWAVNGSHMGLHVMNAARVRYFDERILEAHSTSPIADMKMPKRFRRRQIKVLDVGCGGGLASLELAKLGYDVTAVDMSPNSIAVAKKFHAAWEKNQTANKQARGSKADQAEANLQLRYAVADAYKLSEWFEQENINKLFEQETINKLAYEAGVPEDDATVQKYREGEKFHAVVMGDFLEHIHDLPRLVDGLKPLLKTTGGVVVFDTVARTSASFIVTKHILELTGFIPSGTHDWRLFVNPAEAETLFAERGFQVGNFSGLVPTPKALMNIVGLKTGLTQTVWSDFAITKATPGSLASEAPELAMSYLGWATIKPRSGKK